MPVESSALRAMQMHALQAALGGEYVIEREVGQGGMATVYLARDLRHRRRVAIKLLHPDLSAALGSERFLREIELTASLQHPHILPLFDSGSSAGLLYYVMPYIEGETLRGRLTRERQLPVDQAVRLAREMADALEYAHGHGVIHRDIKPENVLLQGGPSLETVHALVADFGIALALQRADGARLTGTGLSLGTPQYMAPEQATAEQQVDARSDVYALAAVLYEMLAGEPPFTGPNARAIVARAMTEEPRALAQSRPSVPAHVDAAVRIGLAKLPADRYSSAGAFAAALVGSPTSDTRWVPAARLWPARSRTWGVLAAGALLTAALGFLLGRTSAQGAKQDSRGPVRFTIQLDSTIRQFGELALSPDGRTLVYAAEGPEGARLYVRRTDEIAARPIAGTENGSSPFFSPDGAWIGFFGVGAIRKVRLEGGAPIDVTRVAAPSWFGGGTWTEDGVIYYAVSPQGALYRVSADGGSATRVAVSDTTVRTLTPHPLPGGRALLVTTTSDFNGGNIAVLDLATGRLREFGSGVGARYVEGHVLYAGLRGELFRRRFDAERLEPVGVVEQLGTGLGGNLSDGATGFDAVSRGIVYRQGSQSGAGKLTLTDSVGRLLRVLQVRNPWTPHFSPDGGRVAYGAYAPGRDSSDIWVTELKSGTTQRLTTDGNDNNDPTWSPDGRRIAYSKNAPGGKDVFVQSVDGGPEQRLIERPGSQWPTDWTRVGNALLLTELSDDGNLDLLVGELNGGTTRPYLGTTARETGARISPDGQWLAYESDETGREEVYVQSYPKPAHKILVSTSGGQTPVWGADGRALYYWQGNQMIVARLSPSMVGGLLTVRDRISLFRAPYLANNVAMYDVSPDGSQFVIVMSDATASRLVVALYP